MCGGFPGRAALNPRGPRVAPWGGQRRRPAALRTLKVKPSEVVTDAAPVYPGVLDELMPQAWHHVEPYANNPIEADHSRLKHRLRSMRGLRTDPTAQTIIADMPSCRTSDAATTNSDSDAPPALRVAAAFTELAHAI